MLPGCDRMWNRLPLKNVKNLEYFCSFDTMKIINAIDMHAKERVTNRDYTINMPVLNLFLNLIFSPL